MGDAKAQSLTMHGLESARGFIQSKVADRLQTKNTPIIKFVLDPGVKMSAATSQALRDVMEENADNTDHPAADESELDSEIEDGKIEDDDDVVDDENVSGSAETR
jgi:ribosome-binding factor A